MKPESILKKKAGQSSNEDPNKVVRSKRISIWATEEEYAQIEKNQQASRDNSLAAFCRNRALSNQQSDEEPSGYLVQALIQDVRKLTLAISKVGVNVNQIARSLNTKKNQPRSTAMLEEIKKYLQALKPLQAVSSILLKACSLVFKSKK